GAALLRGRRADRQFDPGRAPRRSRRNQGPTQVLPLGRKPMTINLFDDSPADTETLVRLHRRLEYAADDAGVLDIAYRTIDSPVGPLLLAATAVGLVRVAFDIEGHDTVLTRLAERIS